MITLDLSRCSGCRRCEVNCAFFHSGKISRNGSRIKVVQIEEAGIDLPVVCQHCKERYCVKCPQSALNIGSLGQVMVSPTLCTGCGSCETLCPIGAIQLYDDIPYLCDLCGGDPRCVTQCTLKAISYEPEVTETVSLRSFKRSSGKLSPEEKRMRYALRCAQVLRDRWLAERRR